MALRATKDDEDAPSPADRRPRRSTGRRPAGSMCVFNGAGTGKPTAESYLMSTLRRLTVGSGCPSAYAAAFRIDGPAAWGT